MRRRLTLGSTLLAIVLAFTLPATTAAASGYTYKVVSNYCSGTTVIFKVKNIAAGYTKANKLTIESWAQRKAGSWQTVYTWPKAKYKFTRNGAKHVLTAWRKFNGNDPYLNRIVMRLRAWNNRTLLASISLNSRKC